MCVEPATMTLAATAISAIGSGVGTLGQMNTADYNAQVARNNAEAARARGVFNAERVQERGDDLKAEQTVGFAKAGVVGGTGTAAAVVGDTARKTEMDVLAMLYGAESEAIASENQAAMFEHKGKMSAITGALNIGSTLLTGGSNYLKAGGTNPFKIS